ncbi:MAG: hypothetical protein ABXS92_07340 [Sulfurimonas sp.]
MKHFTLWTALLIAFAAVTTLHAETKRYEIKSGMIEYAISGSMNMMGVTSKTTGTGKMIFKEWGNTELHSEEKITTVMGRKEKQQELTKMENGTFYAVDFEEKAIITFSPEMLSRSEYSDIQKGKEMLQQMGGKKIGEEKVLGYNCEVWGFMQSRIWLHKGILLKQEANVMGTKYTTEATLVKFNVKVSDEDFKLPDFPMKTMEEMMQEKMHRPGNDGPGQMPQMTPEQMQQMQEMMKSFSGN